MQRSDASITASVRLAETGVDPALRRDDGCGEVRGLSALNVRSEAAEEALEVIELERGPLIERFRRVLGEIRRGEFARRFQDERAQGYPTLAAARLMIEADSPQSKAETAVRNRKD